MAFIRLIWTMLRLVVSKVQELCTLNEAEQILAFVTKTGLRNHPDVVAKLIYYSAISSSGCLKFAESIFEVTSMDNPFICDTMIRAYCKSVFPIRAVSLYNRMHRFDVETNSYSYTFVLRACAKVLWCTEEDTLFYGPTMWRKVAEIHCRLFKTWFSDNHFVQNSLIYTYSQCGLLDIARKIFDELPNKSVTTLNTMICAYDRVNDFGSADLILQSMPKKDVVSWNTLIARYLKLKDIESAKTAFEEMPVRDSISWNSMIAGYVRIKNYDEALRLFRQMQIANVEATEITLISVLGACAETGALDMGRKIHKSLKQKQIKIEGFLGNALVDMYAKSGNLGWAWEVFNELSLKHVSSWNAMIVGLAAHGFSDEALELFAKMENSREGTPNRVTFIGVLSACSHKGLVDEGRRYFGLMKKEYSIVPDVKHYGCMVDLLSRWGFLTEAHYLINTMPFEANAVIWRTLLGACRIHGNVEFAEESFQHLAEMKQLGDGDYVLLSNIYAESERWEDVERVRNDMVRLQMLKKPGASLIDMK